MRGGDMKLKEIRAKYNLNQTDLAKITGLSQKSISNYENAQTYPNVEAIIKLADYFRISVDELLDHEVPYVLNRVQFSEKQLEVIESIKDLTDEDCRYLLASISAIKVANQEKENTIKKFKN